MADSTPVADICKNARALLRAGKVDAAIALLEEACGLDEKNPELQESLGSMQFMAGNFDAALACFRRATEVAPRRGSAYINLGAVYNRLGDYAKAVEMLRRGISFDMKSSEGFYNLGIAYRHLKQWNMAIPAYREAIRINPKLAEAYQNLGNVYTDMGNHYQAIANYKKALEIKPDFDRARRGLEKAQNLLAVEKQSESPFGRLVNPVMAARETAPLPMQHARLTDAERLKDRGTLDQLSRDLHRKLDELLQHLKRELDPGVHNLSKTIAAQSGKSGPLTAAYSEFAVVQVKFGTLLKTFNQTISQIREHESRVR